MCVYPEDSELSDWPPQSTAGGTRQQNKAVNVLLTSPFFSFIYVSFCLMPTCLQLDLALQL